MGTLQTAAEGSPPIQVKIQPKGMRRVCGPSGRSLKYQAAVTAARTRISKPVLFFLTSQIVPWIIPIGSMRFSLYRMVLVILFLPCVVMWVRGRVGKIKAPDLLLFFFCTWCTISLVQTHGIEFAIEPAGMLFLETMGAYLVARCFIRSAADFLGMAFVLFSLVVLLLPFAIIETLTGTKPLLELFGTVFPTIEVTMMQPRGGLWRVQGPFDHSIMFGVWCGSIVASTHLLLGKDRNPLLKWLMTVAVIVTASLSISAGAITAMVAQCSLLVWNRLFRQVESRWILLLGLVAAMYLFIEIMSNQSVPSFYISRFSFDQQSAGFRLLIWQFGSQSVENHPWFGVGFNEWDRPAWMPPSIDMFWLVNAVRHGIPAAVLMFATFSSAVLTVGLKTGLSVETQACRLTYMICMIGFFLVGWTVHFYNASNVLFMFLLGSGMWILNEETSASGGSRNTRQNETASRGMSPVRRIPL